MATSNINPTFICLSLLIPLSSLKTANWRGVHMKRLISICIFVTVLSGTAQSSHITGGEMYYVYVGTSGGLYQYNVTMKLFQRCGSGRQFPNPAIISIFDKTNNVRITDMTVSIDNTENISLTSSDPCITNPPNVCYDVAYYTFSVALPPTQYGYIMASQVNYRINGINNLTSSGNIGATYTAEIPGIVDATDGHLNSSAKFTGSDLVVICANNDFSYSFAASDDDGDELRYYFCDAYASTNSSGGTTIPTSPPPFPPVPYSSPFSATAPLGPGVVLDQTTGMITGIAPPSGIYVVTVCVVEIRNGVVLATQRKDIQVHIADCDIAAASLLPEYSLCKNTQTISIANQSNSPLIVSTEWEFYDASNSLIHTATGSSVIYTFPAIGDYTVKLIINRGQACNDSTTTIIHVFPGFVPDFNATGICITKPSFFTDQTTSVYGVPNSWTWDFGELGASNDYSTVQDPVYTYPFMGVKKVILIVTDTRGCRDTIVKNMTIIDKPPLTLGFNDTLICLNDRLMLQASGSGIFSWTPPVNIMNANTATPTVNPVNTTTYYVELDENGCKNKDSVKVRVVDRVTIIPMSDTLICRGDTIQLRIQSDGLLYSWTPTAQVIDPLVQNPFVITNNSLTNYIVSAVIGGCSATENILVSTVPYPTVNAGADSIICYNTMALLKGSTDGNTWSWSPPNSLSNPALLNPIAYPPRTTFFVLTAFDTRGCPKAGRDTVKITVNPKMHISAGADTAVVTGQPLQLNASGSEFFTWSPPNYLSAVDIPNPVALFNNPGAGIKYKVIGYNADGCADSAIISIKVYKTLPSVFVPTAFTPNNDGRNDVLRPIAVGMKYIESFNIYNRWGQLIFTTTINGHGWDGRINGQLQTTGAFVWSVKARDYLGKTYFQKGVFTLIR